MNHASTNRLDHVSMILNQNHDILSVGIEKHLRFRLSYKQNLDFKN